MAKYRVEYLAPNLIGTGGKWTLLSEHWFRWRAIRVLARNALSGTTVPEWRMVHDGRVWFECVRRFGAGAGNPRFADEIEL